MLKATLQRLDNPRETVVAASTTISTLRATRGGDDDVYPDSMTGTAGTLGVRDDL